MQASEQVPSIQIGEPGVTVEAGDHICAFYPTLAERDEILLPYLSEGMLAGEKCIAVLDTDDLDGIRQAVSGQGLPSPKDGNQLELRRSRNAYLANGSFETEAMLKFWEDHVGAAVAEGFPFARVAGEMTWALSNLPGVDQLVGYEAKLNRLLPRYPQVVLCLYELERFDGEVLVDVLKTHPKVLLGGMVLDNPYYLEPEEFLASR
ncbi:MULTISPECIES: MEDS domain-containing protein [unclassified Nocardioides]|uniref:MEDS domain-containing protein n=1 Tax=unclassified Nocardioides TaxID=2615069 RepID=UPI000056FD67|nr:MULTISPECIES: MEDS domain-containing protein [unclassified Nocardioides]ABL79408.1 conserved hypothetical protein [Nocardioides sp. JS614]